MLIHFISNNDFFVVLLLVNYNSPGKEDDDGDEVHTVRCVGSPPPGSSAREDHGSDELAPAQFHSEVSR